MQDLEGSQLSLIQRHHVEAALAELEAGVEHPYGPATKYELVHGGQTYAPKAVVGLAHRHATGRFPPRSFSGGENHANAVLERLGFAVQLITGTGEDWTDEQNRLLVSDYFDMLNSELLGRPYNKSAHNKRLRESIRRSKGSIERKHMNVSAVMVSLALPYIDGYKPNMNRQQRLTEAVEAYLHEHPDYFERPVVVARIEPQQVPMPTAIASAEDFFEDPPDAEIPKKQPEPWKSRKGRRIDYAARDAANRALGRAGEVFAVELERRRLTEMGRDDLAARVRHVAAEDGDGMGYDVLSWNYVNDTERWLEVKTTTLGKFHPFLVTSNELACSEAMPDLFEVFRVFQFTGQPRVFRLLGSLRDRCELEPALYRAGPPYTDWKA